ncbi:putative extensin [Iris pallida]|uniref:Extensin n=1 Tax=Iris pallida TaxID=29817 RepID=A0AAX6FVH5_IRIPA|nr:putative extensin [Iris pallida]KAJ6836631.1 putative extensin [Iris pallida]
MSPRPPPGFRTCAPRSIAELRRALSSPSIEARLIELRWTKQDGCFTSKGPQASEMEALCDTYYGQDTAFPTEPAGAACDLEAAEA